MIEWVIDIISECEVQAWADFNGKRDRRKQEKRKRQLLPKQDRYQGITDSHLQAGWKMWVENVKHYP